MIGRTWFSDPSLTIWVAVPSHETWVLQIRWMAVPVHLRGLTHRTWTKVSLPTLKFVIWIKMLISPAFIPRCLAVHRNTNLPLVRQATQFLNYILHPCFFSRADVWAYNQWSATSFRLSRPEFLIEIPNLHHWKVNSFVIIVFVPLIVPPISMIFELSSPNIEALTSTHPDCQVTVFGNFNTHNKGWLLNSPHT